MLLKLIFVFLLSKHAAFSDEAAQSPQKIQEYQREDLTEEIPNHSFGEEKPEEKFEEEEIKAEHTEEEEKPPKKKATKRLETVKEKFVDGFKHAIKTKDKVVHEATKLKNKLVKRFKKKSGLIGSRTDERRKGIKRTTSSVQPSE